MFKFLVKTIIVSTAVVATPIVLANEIKKWIKEQKNDQEFMEMLND